MWVAEKLDWKGLRSVCKVVNWIQVAHYREQEQALVNKATNFGIS
jgi:hypothetical protein